MVLTSTSRPPLNDVEKSRIYCAASLSLWMTNVNVNGCHKSSNSFTRVSSTPGIHWRLNTNKPVSLFTQGEPLYRLNHIVPLIPSQTPLMLSSQSERRTRVRTNQNRAQALAHTGGGVPAQFSTIEMYGISQGYALNINCCTVFCFFKILLKFRSAHIQ